MDECCERKEWAFETTADLYASFKAWIEKAGENAPSMKRFSMTLTERGLEKGAQCETRKKGFKGIRLIRANYGDSSRYGS
jgi:phage/plasmid-associated DNA primase